MRIAKIVLERLSLVFLGALAALICVQLMMDTSPPEVERLRKLALWLWISTVYVGFWFRTARKNAPARELSPAKSGTGVVVGTGLAAAYFVTRDSSGSAAVLLPAAIGLLTIVTAWFVFRFASKHADEIGEARFVTTNPDDGKSGGV
ncbi:hypothetical protein IAG41_12740 [Sphingomonas sp. JC676]|uniref:hypothetical protein n=1 Tax=Sphingomonas sp. JC676 TaxID=2768065 RepID=UPI001657CC55|nr:hypothetical protein [Sphingomonas sp. JC676]MBC9033258.1 hypothetical protein [Sphingomonas sp. JC676]